jgi:hypothetical protein
MATRQLYSQRCDTFFVEDDTATNEYRYQEEMRKVAAREQQFLIADELSRQASDEYAEDVLSHMEQMEVIIP